MRTAAAFAHFAHDAARHVIARQQLRRTARVLIARHVAPAFFLVIGGLRFVVRRNIVEHEALAFAVAQHAAFAAHAFRHQNAAHARRPHHPRGMELHELHIHQRRARAIGERLPVARVFPAVARDLESAPDAARPQHDGFGGEQLEAAALAIVAERAGDAARIGQQFENRVLHVHIDPEMDAVILQSADHFEARAVAGVREARIAVAAEVALQDFAVFGAIENRAPGFEFVHAVGRLLGMQLGHARIIQILPAAHGVGEMHAPVIAVVDVPHGGGHAAFGHHGVGFAQQRFADQPDFDARARCFDGRAQTRAACADHEHVVIERLVFGHLEESPVRPDAHRAHAHVEIGETDPEQAEPRKPHVARVQAAHAVVGFLANGRFGNHVFDAADQVPERVAAEGVTAQQDHVHQRAPASRR